MLKPARVIGIEEHFFAEGFEEKDHPRSKLLWDLGETRLEDMDRLGIDMQVLSLMSPGIQGVGETSWAISAAKRVNDYLAAACRRNPSRFAGFAALPTQDPKAAADELARCVQELGFKGGMVNGHTGGHYLDEAMFTPLWERAVELDVPLYLHPAMEASPWAILGGYPEFARAAWGWMAETGAHALRIVGSGVFERMPTAKLILGHMGEALPYVLTRIDSRTFNRFQRKGLSKKLSEYIQGNIVITTSGMFDDAALKCAMESMGADSIVFSIDYPLEDSDRAMRWLHGLPVSVGERDAIACKNAERILKIAS
jgi:2,3-dihydroxybenzoate decarboxylase